MENKNVNKPQNPQCVQTSVTGSASLKYKYVVKSINNEQVKEWFLKKHYAKRVPIINYCFGIYDGLVLQGVIAFGTPPNKNLNNIIGIRTLELNRLVINEGLESNILSYFVSKSLKLLPKPMIIISYADTAMSHNGYIYQATNWLYTGLGSGDVEFLKNGKSYHRKGLFNMFGTGSVKEAILNGFEVLKVLPKHRYIYLIGSKKEVKDFKIKLPFKTEPYPKGINKRYNASYSPLIQTTLF